MSVRRSAASFGLATVLGHLSQFVWLVVGIRIMSAADFGTVLAAQALYGVLQIVVDIGTNSVGARMAARDELDDNRRGQILRMRLTLALTVAPVAVVFGLLNVSGSFEATLPFVIALFLFAVLNVWEPYGSGDARPWATYMFARSGVLALVACMVLAAGASFPIALAGTLECVAIVAVMLIFRRAPLKSLRLAGGARGGPWRSVFLIGWPALATQSAMAAGTLVLSGSGRPAAAGTFAACVRLLSGINAINGIVATALYPRLAQDVDGRSADDGRVVATALGLIAVVGAGATATCVLLSEPIAVALLGEASPARRSVLVLTMAAAPALGNIFMFTYQMVARERELATLLPFAVGAPITIALAVGAVTAGADVELVAGSLLAGQVVTMGALGLRVRAAAPAVAAASGRAMVLALLVALIACSSLLPSARVPAGLVLLALAAALLVGMRGLIATVMPSCRFSRS